MNDKHKTCSKRKGDPQASARGGALRRWFLANSVVAGVLALVWLVLRSGPKPSRLAYPCQQASLSAATLALGAPLVAAMIAARRQLAAGIRMGATLSIHSIVAIGTDGYHVPHCTIVALR